MNSTSCNEAVLEFDAYGFAILSGSGAEGDGEPEDGRCHVYSPRPSTQGQWETVCAEYSSSDDLQRDSKKLHRLLRSGDHNSMRAQIWKLFLGTSQTRSENKFDYVDGIIALRCKMKKYGLSEVSTEQNVHKINSLLDTRSWAEVMTVEGEREREGEGERGGESKKEGEMEEEREGEREREEERERGEESREGEKEEGGRKMADEEDREWLSRSRQIMIDIIRTFPTHQMFTGETAAGKISLFRVLMMYAEYNSTVGYCQGMAYIAALLLMHMHNEEDVFWSIVTLFDGEKYLSGFYDSKLSRIQTCAAVFSLMLRDRQPELAEHLHSLSIHPLMYMTSWFMCLYSSLPCWDTVLSICDLVFLEGYESLFRVGLSILEVCAAELLAMSEIEAVLPFIQKLPTRLTSHKVLMPVIWRTSVSRSEVEQYLDAVVRGSSDNLPRPLKRSAPAGEFKTPSKRRKIAGDHVPVTPVTQSFLSRLVTALTPAARQTPQPLMASAALASDTLGNASLSECKARSSATVKRKRRTRIEEGKREGRREGEVSVVARSHEDCAPNSIVRSSRKRKRENVENYSPRSNAPMIEMKDFSNTKQAPFSLSPYTNSYSPSLPLFLSPSLPPSPFSPFSPSSNHDGGTQDTPYGCLGNAPVVQFQSSFSGNTSFSKSPLRRSKRLVKRKGQGSFRGRLSQTVSFPSPRCPLQDTLYSSSCGSAEKVAFKSFSTPTPIRANQVRSRGKRDEHC